MLDSTTYPLPRYPAMVRALAGDSTMTSRLAPFAVTSALVLRSRTAGLVLAATPSLPHNSRTSWSALRASPSAPLTAGRIARIGRAAVRPLRRLEATSGRRLIAQLRSHRSSVHQTLFEPTDSH